MENEFILIFDTETINIEKPFMYDLGYIVAQYSEEESVYKAIVKRQFIIEQVYTNRMLFQTSYYAKKRPLYTALLKGRTAKMKKLGHALQILKADIERYDIHIASAFNSPFDTRVFQFNTDFNGINNPIEHLVIVDIMGVASIIHKSEDYIKFCQDNGYYGTSGFIKTNAEITFRYITKDNDFIESHTALHDSEIELDILNYALLSGAVLEPSKKAFVELLEPLNTLTIKKNGKAYTFKYRTRKNRKNGVIDLVT